MKKYIISLFSSMVVLFVFAGCAPQLARVKHGATENQWKGYIQDSYKDWEPPPTLPPINDAAANGDTANNFSLDVVPAPVPGNDLTISGTGKNDSTSPEITDVSTDAKQLAPAIAPDSTTYSVEKGDTLWSISCKFYNNDGTKWKEIQEANKDVLSSPGSIKPGLTLTIPTK